MFHIIIPTYNRKKTIIRSIKSVLNQKHKDFHIYIIDDGSSDNTKEILKPYLEEYKWKITYTYKENWWVWSARNMWIEEALENSKHIENDWVIFLDSDDKLVENTFNKILLKIKEVNIDKAKIISFKAINQYWKETCFVKEAKKFLWFEEMISWKYLKWEWASTINLSIFSNKKNRFNEEVNWWEWLLWLSLYKQTNVYTTTTTIRIYYQDNISLIRWELDKKRILNNIKINELLLKNFWEDFKKYNTDQLWIIYFVLARMYALDKERIKSIKYFIYWIRYKIDFKRIVLYILSLLPYWIKINNILINKLHK